MKADITNPKGEPDMNINYFIIPGLRLKGNRVGSNNRIEEITIVCSNYFDQNIDEVKSGWRKSEVVKPRQIAMWIATVKNQMRLIDVARYFNRDHSTVICAREKVYELMQFEKGYKQQVDEILGILGL